MMINNYSLLVEKLRKYCRKYFLLQLAKGLVVLVTVLTIYVSVLLVIEYTFYTSGTLRMSGLIGLLGLTVFICYRHLLSAFSYLVGLKKLAGIQQAKLVSQHFPELKDHLVNIVELGEMDDKSELVLCSIDQKIETLSSFCFRDYYNFGLIRLSTLMLCLSFCIVSVTAVFFTGLYTEAGYRLLHFNQVFTKPAPFRFILMNHDLKVKKGSSVDLRVRCTGSEVPDNLYVNIGGENFIMSVDDSVYSYKLEHIQNSFPVFFTDLKYLSDKYFVEAIPDPLLVSYSVHVDVPRYTNLPDQEFQDAGNLKVPFGSNLKWVLNCADTDSLFLEIDGQIFSSDRDGESFTVGYSCTKESKYSVLLSNQFVQRKELISFNIELIPDLFPEITVVQYQDSVFLKRFYFKGEIADDYGFHDLVFNIRNSELDSVIQVPIPANLNFQDFYYYIDFQDFNQFGKSFNYYFTVRDNDDFHHFKRSTSEVFDFQMMNESELHAAKDQFFKDIEGLVDQSKSVADEIKKDLEDFKYRSISENLTEWESQQMIQNILNKRNRLQESLEQLRNKNSQMNNLNNSFGSQEEALLEKQKQIEQLLEEMMTDELSKLFEELNELARDFDQDRLNEMMSKMSFPIDDLSKQLDRNLEMLKKMRLEQKLEGIVEQLEKLAETENSNIELIEQKELDKLFDREVSNKESLQKIADDIEEAFEMNRELDKKMNLFPVDDELNEIKENFEQIENSISQKRKNKLKQQIPDNENTIRNLAFSISQMTKESEMQQSGENIANLKQILKNLIYMSFAQEEVLNLTFDLGINDPLLSVVQKREDLLLEQSIQIQDSLYALARRTPAVNSKINSELVKIDYLIRQSVQDLKDGLTGNVPKLQQNTVMAFNELALFLNEALENLEKAMANSMPGDQECDKPGGGGAGQSMKKLKEAQQSLKDQLQKMIEGLKKGEKGQMSEEIGNSLIQQEMMKSMIREMLMDDGIGSSAKEQLRAIDQLIEQNRLDLIQKNIGDRMIARQNLILDRLLKAEKSEMERDVDDQRESKTAEQLFYSNPDLFLEYKVKEKKNFGEILYNDFRLRKFYEDRFRNYMNEVNQ